MEARFKYPRTYHLPYSLSKTDDDKTLKDDSMFQGMEVIVTIKMDGENTTIYPDGYIHARSINGTGYEWQNWLKSVVWNFCTTIPDGWRIVGENLYAKHSIGYCFKNLSETFQVFAVINENNEFLAWDDIKMICEELNLNHVTEIYRGVYDKTLIMSAFENMKKALAENGQEIEGFVIRDVQSFPLEDFNKHAAKFVRANHVQTDKHWRENWEKNTIDK